MDINWTTYRQFAQQHFPFLCQKRPENSHKGMFGTVGIIGGSEGMSGAVILAAQAAFKLGAGKVKIGFAQNQLPIAVLERQPEIMLYTAQQLLQQSDIDAFVIGCGLSCNAQAQQLLQTLNTEHCQKPIVWDADALNLFAIYPRLQTCVKNHHIITPHPTEAARLLNKNTIEINQERQKSAQNLWQRFACVSILKGHQSIVQTSMDDFYVNQSGHAGLATAGSGDVLAGIIASLLAQGINSGDAAKAGVWLHGAAAEVLSLQGIGPIGMVASELFDAARMLRNQLSVTS